MAQVANTFETYDSVGNREELANRIYQITPEETPLISLIGRESVASTHPEWQTDELASPDLNNNVPEGNDWSYDASSVTTRVGNYTQISEKSVVVSRTQDKTNKAGRRSELAYQVSKRGVELRTDMEVILLSNQASSAGSGNGATNRKLGGLRAWLASNDDMGSGGSSGGFNSGTGIVDAATNGTQRAFTKAILDSIILTAYNAGGNPTACMVSPYVKTVFSTFMDDSNVSQPRTDYKRSGQNAIIASAEIYKSDFGEIRMIPNRQMARAGASIARNAFLLDPRMVKVGIFDDIMTHKPAKTGDAEKRVLNVEYTLKVKNEKAHAVAADLYGLSASS